MAPALRGRENSPRLRGGFRQSQHPHSRRLQPSCLLLGGQKGLSTNFLSSQGWQRLPNDPLNGAISTFHTCKKNNKSIHANVENISAHKLSEENRRRNKASGRQAEAPSSPSPRSRAGGCFGCCCIIHHPFLSTAPDYLLLNTEPTFNLNNITLLAFRTCKHSFRSTGRAGPNAQTECAPRWLLPELQVRRFPARFPSQRELGQFAPKPHVETPQAAADSCARTVSDGNTHRLADAQASESVSGVMTRGFIASGC